MKNRKKAVAAIVAAVLLLVVLLFPIRMNLKDGGSVQYKSLTYSITKVHRLMPESEAEKFKYTPFRPKGAKETDGSLIARVMRGDMFLSHFSYFPFFKFPCAVPEQPFHFRA